MQIAVDIDGTLDAYPNELRGIMGSVMAAGHQIYILTGTQDDVATQDDWQKKVDYVKALGCESVWDKLIVVSGDDIAKAKAKWCKDNGVDVLIDNDKDNAKAVTAEGILVLVPWGSRKG
jgi:hypothetical protein